MCTDHAERVATPPDLNIQPCFEQAQVLIERPAKIGQARVVSGLQVEFALGFGD